MVRDAKSRRVFDERLESRPRPELEPAEPERGPEPVGRRCPWAESSDLMRAYHDEEWGTPSTDDRHLFEMLVLEGAQAGLSWSTILNKRVNYRRAFDDFEPEVVARYGDAKLAALRSDQGIVRNRLKIASAVTNARALLATAERYGSFSCYLWGLVDGAPLLNAPRSAADVPARTERSDRISAEMRAKGFCFVGPIILYSYLQSVGIVNDHLVSCHRASLSERQQR